MWHRNSAACALMSLVFFVIASSCHGQDEVDYKDVTITKDTVGGRLYIPKSANPNQKLPLLVYYHGGAFLSYHPADEMIHNHVSSLVKKANVVALSVDYRSALDYPLPAAYDDSWAALKWVASHSAGRGPEEWINKHADFLRIFLSGDSAGANIAHNMVMKQSTSSKEKLDGFNVAGIILLHPYFWGSKPIGNKELRSDDARQQGDRIWLDAGREAFGLDDPRVNPLVDPKLPALACKKVLVLIAESDLYRARGFYYSEALRSNGWKGKVELMETPEEGHCFFYYHPKSQKALAMLERISSFINS